VNYSLKLKKSGVFGHELRRILAAGHFVEDYWFAGPCPVSSMPKHNTALCRPHPFLSPVEILGRSMDSVTEINSSYMTSLSISSGKTVCEMEN
jgi:hypothetical protein